MGMVFGESMIASPCTLAKRCPPSLCLRRHPAYPSDLHTLAVRARAERGVSDGRTDIDTIPCLSLTPPLTRSSLL